MGTVNSPGFPDDAGGGGRADFAVIFINGTLFQHEFALVVRNFRSRGSRAWFNSWNAASPATTRFTTRLARARDSNSPFDQAAVAISFSL